MSSLRRSSEARCGGFFANGRFCVGRFDAVRFLDLLWCSFGIESEVVLSERMERRRASQGGKLCADQSKPSLLGRPLPSDPPLLPLPTPQTLQYAQLPTHSVHLY